MIKLYPFNVKVNGAIFNECHDWCLTTFDRDYNSWCIDTGTLYRTVPYVTFEFDEEKQLTIFLLKWSEQTIA